jgi:hypothetical protein
MGAAKAPMIRRSWLCKRLRQSVSTSPACSGQAAWGEAGRLPWRQIHRQAHQACRGGPAGESRTAGGRPRPGAAGATGCRFYVIAGHCDGPRRAGYSRGSRRQVVGRTGGAAAGGGRTPFRRRKRRRRVRPAPKAPRPRRNVRSRPKPT